jgi:hypothetical protein
MVQNADGSPVFVGSVTAQFATQTYRGDILPTAFPPAYRIVLPAGTYKLVATTFVFDVESNMGAGVLLSTDVTEMIAVAGDTTRDIIVPAPPPLFPVSGIVTSSGSLPTVGSVVFESVDGKALSIAPVDGMYNLKLPVGDYNVATILTAGAL